ncbi:thiamine pyrophosphate-dependent enzyme [Acinetobacter sp. HY1485]|uniref:thiamine pyrophosphate-dependent enzyme n=1 Tax=Acinetobacter sp. HY1485 TaxID=2970918 RepID=UPI0022B96EB4|nr:thiamine pyrophosphate-dependent enzyme [Acinetobacter sp. HY1485]
MQIPSDIINHSVEYDNSSLKFYPEDTFSQKNKDFTEHLQALVNTAKKPVFILDKAIERWKLIPILEQFFKDTYIPFICMSTAKFLMNENTANCHGVFGSTRSLKLIKEADLIIGIGAKFSDITTQFFSIPTPKNNFINLFEDHTYINNQHFYNLSFKKVFEHIQIYPKAPISLHESINPEVSTSNVLQHKNFWPVIAKFIQNQDIILGEMGTSNIALTTLNLDKKITYISQPLWGSIGYTLPALLGTLFAAPQKRQILFIGDGSLQLTVQELSTILRFNFKPIIFIINNKGYTIERAILGTHSSYNNIENWQYLNLPDVFNPQTTIKKYKITHLSELKDCLIDIKKHDHLILVEVIFDPLDMPETLEGFGKLANLYDYGDRN